MEIVLGVVSFAVMFGMWVVAPQLFHKKSEE